MAKIKKRRVRNVRISKEGANKWRNLIINSPFWLDHNQKEIEEITGIPDATLSLIKKGNYDRGAEDWECLRYFCRPINPQTQEVYTPGEMMEILFEYPDVQAKKMRSVKTLKQAITRQIKLDEQDIEDWIEVRCSNYGISPDRLKGMMDGTISSKTQNSPTGPEIGKLSSFIFNDDGERFDDKWLESLE